MPVNPKIYGHLVLFENRIVESGRGVLSNFFNDDLRFLNKKNSRVILKSCFKIFCRGS